MQNYENFTQSPSKDSSSKYNDDTLRQSGNSMSEAFYSDLRASETPPAPISDTGPMSDDDERRAYLD